MFTLSSDKDQRKFVFAFAMCKLTLRERFYFPVETLFWKFARSLKIQCVLNVFYFRYWWLFQNHFSDCFSPLAPIFLRGGMAGTYK